MSVTLHLSVCVCVCVVCYDISKCMRACNVCITMHVGGGVA